MSYGEFTLNKLENQFQLIIIDQRELFPDIKSVNPSQLLRETLTENIPLALGIDTEKARSELIVMPVLVELRRLFNRQISLFSGREFNIDSSVGLNGTCDFIISHSPQQLSVKAPVFTAVEAKNDNIRSGIPQCIAEMLAAQKFNEQQNNYIPCIYGAVTTGSLWKFIKLEGTTVYIELKEHFIENIESLLGILYNIVATTRPNQSNT
ncbi:hypothetical protein [Aerosakkonema funiforme]|uniref:hypothetical protein n=1 Tax=Aerosakkonema funiforme TaxID=1246630 RepID=UPI0035BB91B8